MTSQLAIWDTPEAKEQGIAEERPEYLTEQLITYIGNKRSLLGVIKQGLDKVKARISKQRLRILDGFAGSGVVSRYFKQHAEYVVSNDIEPYAEVIGKCYLTNESAIDRDALTAELNSLREQLEDSALEAGIITRLYSPKDDRNIEHGERVFYTGRNARYLDTARRLIAEIPESRRHYFLAPLLSEASVHVNTSGVFKGFYKCSRTGIGKFGGNAENALTRILRKIEVRLPVLSRFECDWSVHRADTNLLVKELPELDVAYYDPPYNQHPYGSNYFMLNLLVDYGEPKSLSPVSGIPADWRRSRYNNRSEAMQAMRQLVRDTKAGHILISFNSEGFISRESMEKMLVEFGKVETIAVPYNTFRGCRNLNDRDIHVSEFLFIVER